MSPIDQPKTKLGYQEYCLFPDNGYRHEIINRVTVHRSVEPLSSIVLYPVGGVDLEFRTIEDNCSAFPLP